MKRNFHDIEDVFADAEGVPSKKGKKLLAKIDRIEKGLSAKLVARRRKDQTIMAKTWSEAARTYVS